MEKTSTFTVEPNEAARRLDIFLAARMPELTRSRIKGLVDDGKALVNGSPEKAGHKLKSGDSVALCVPAINTGRLEAETIPLDILYEDKDIIVVNKPAGMAVHPGAGRNRGTLVNALIHHAGELATIGAPLRPGIVHRLDKDTTGVLVVARNDASYLNLAGQFKEHTATRRYEALVWGNVRTDEGRIDLSIGRDSVQRKKISTRSRRTRKAVTNFRVLKRFGMMTLLELRLETGRTHQIRVHLAAIHHPVVGDQVYGKRSIPPTLQKPVLDILKSVKRQMLHACTLGINHPVKEKYIEFNANMPPDMDSLVRALEEQSQYA